MDRTSSKFRSVRSALPLDIVLSALFAIVVCTAFACGQHDTHHWFNRTGIVHLFEWPFDAVANECERYLAPAGFAAVQVSPVNENAVVAHRPWWERYQPVSYRLVTRSGDEAQFRAMVERCNRAGIRVYVDVVLNHMAAGAGIVIGTDGSQANVPARSYPAVPYERAAFHPSCAINNYNDAAEVRNCELVGLPDLNSSIVAVRDLQVQFLNRLIGAGVAGFRVDAAKHMWPQDLRSIYGSLTNLRSDHFGERARPFIYQEVIDMGGEAVKKTDYTHMGLVTEFRFSMEISNAFAGNNKLKWLVSWGEKWAFLPPVDALVFVDNHDNQRTGADHILTYKRPREYRMALAFMLAHPYGVPRVMSSFAFNSNDQGPPADASEHIVPATFDAHGQCVGGWVCEHRWPEVAGMIGFRNTVGSTPVTYWWDDDDNQIGFCRGHRGMVFFNNGQTDLRRVFMTCLPRGVYCDVFAGRRVEGGCTGANVTVDDSGQALVEVRRDRGVLAVHLGSKL